MSQFGSRRAPPPGKTPQMWRALWRVRDCHGGLKNSNATRSDPPSGAELYGMIGALKLYQLERKTLLVLDISRRRDYL
jgi:hypothetical protein